jgi:hypothetical protein
MAILSHADLEGLWVAAGGSNATADTAASIAQAESGGNTSAILNTAYPSLPGYHPPGAGASPEYSVGLWQINELAHPTYTTAQLLASVSNANAAVAISNGGASFSAWSTYKDGAYKQFLQGGGTPAPQPGPTSGTSTAWIAPSAHGGYVDLRNSLARHVPTQLQHSQRLGVATLHVLRRKSKLKG